MTNTASQPLAPPRPSEDAHARFLKLFLTSEKSLLRYVSVMVPYRADAEDVVQQTALALWNRFEDYDPALPFEAWAVRFARMEALAFLKRHARWSAFADEALTETLWARHESISGELDQRMIHLTECLQKLSPEQRDLIEGYYSRDESVPQLAAKVGRSSEAIHKALQRIRQALQKCIERALKTLEVCS